MLGPICLPGNGCLLKLVSTLHVHTPFASGTSMCTRTQHNELGFSRKASTEWMHQEMNRTNYSLNVLRHLFLLVLKMSETIDK